ncbi:unnamed protein product [Adineta ricciae]|uniref:Uncharacterized protein n=1 Tax=Adineta ricciae TaxID=249248 RepID=A0A814IV98_ADIRI|nr:unnamed protein product [Adineta ricciae]
MSWFMCDLVESMPVASFKLIVVSILVLGYLVSLSEHQPINKDQCKTHHGILCVRDELKNIMNEARKIVRKTVIIEEYIKDTIIIDKLYQTVAMEVNETQSSQPSSEWHVHFLAQPNIDKKSLIKLLWEAHNAMLHLANSIDEVHSPKDAHAKASDSILDEIQKELKYEMVCRYRNILNVYVEQLEPVFESKDRIEFSWISGASRSVVHDVRSLVMVVYIRKWMKLVDDVVEQLGRKLN